MAATEANSVIRGRPVNTVYEADELILKAPGSILIESSDDQDDWIYTDTERYQCQRQAEYLGVVEWWQDRAQDGERRGHGQGEDQADEGQA